MRHRTCCAWQRLGYRLVRLSSFPKGNLTACLSNLAARGFQPRHIIDVGANQGRWSRDALRVFPNCSITMIEPQLEMKRRLDKFCRRLAGCQWILAGAGAEPGELPLTLHPDTVSSNFLMLASAAAAAGFQQRMTPVVTLDQVVASSVGEIPDMVKIDVEGFEQEVLRGAQTLLGKTELFFLELQFLGGDDNPSGAVKLMTLMSDYGYAPYDFTWFGKRPLDGAVALSEVAFARKDGPLRGLRGWFANQAA